MLNASSRFHVLRMRTVTLLILLLLTPLMSGIAETTHTVQSGESLDKIGRQYGVKPSAIAAYNDLSNPDRIVPGLVLKIPPVPGAPIDYTVKTGDTLGEIAAANGTTIQAITDLNSITDPRTIQPGQVLKVPTADTLTAVERNPLPANVKRLLDAMPVTRGKWKYIVVHHSASKNGTMKGMDMYHRQKRHMENGLAYHFVIGNGNGIPEGKIEIGNRWKRQIKGGHLASESLNEKSIGICLVGNFEIDRPSETQLKSLYALVSYLRKRCGIPKTGVRTHTQINTRPTACPGKRFPTESLMNNI